jgi:hypothetical protein
MKNIPCRLFKCLSRFIEIGKATKQPSYTMKLTAFCLSAAAGLACCG